MDNVAQNCSPKWYAIIGDNGFGYVSSEVDIVDGLRTLYRATLFQMPDQAAARHYAYCAYAGRWFMRNGWMGMQMQIPTNVPTGYLYVDPEFEAREGGKELPFFPALLH